MSKFITTMADKQIESMGEQLFNSWVEFAPNDQLIVFVDNPELLIRTWAKSKVWANSKNIVFKKIENPKYYEFLEKYKGNPEYCGTYNNGYEYRLDAVKFSHKVYAIQEGLKYVDDNDKYFVWWDADAWLTGEITDAVIEKHLGLQNGFCAYLGRKDWDHSETGFIAFNTSDSDYKLFVESFAKIYDTGNVFKLAQGRTDSHVFDLLRDAFTKQKGKKFINLSENVAGNHVWPETTLHVFSDHAKGPVAKNKILENQIKAPMVSNIQQSVQQNSMMNRYDQIYKLIEVSKPKIISEIGVAQAERAQQMIKEAFKHSDRVIYFGFDVFEDGDAELNSKEMNAKRVSSFDEINNKLTALQQTFPNLFFKLIQGNTNDTLPEYVDKAIELQNATGLIINVKPNQSDFVFIDGGHSVDTIRNDYTAFKDCGLVLMDDYYVADQNGNRPDISKFGCNFLEKEIEKSVLLPIADNIVGGGQTKILVAGTNSDKVKIKQGQSTTTNQKNIKPQASETSLQTGNGKGVKIETRNSIPNEVLQSQVDYACQMMKNHNIPEIISVKLHERWAYLVGGAASYKKPEYLEQIRLAAANKTDVVFTSKTAHDYLISQNIIPWACLLLDPRPHVADYFEINPDVTYFVASQCHQTVFDKLINANAKMYVYHAEVAAGEKDIIKKHFPDAKMLPGGSTSQSRGISILMAMGFYKFKLFGLDSSYPTKPEKVHGINQQKKPIEITVNHNKTKEAITDSKYWTDPELLAQINDMEHITKIFGHLILDCQSDGLMKDMLNYWHKEKQTFEDLYKI